MVSGWGKHLACGWGKVSSGWGYFWFPVNVYTVVVCVWQRIPPVNSLSSKPLCVHIVYTERLVLLPVSLLYINQTNCFRYLFASLIII